jgi:hypothetical protein
VRSQRWNMRSGCEYMGHFLSHGTPNHPVVMDAHDDWSCSMKQPWWRLGIPNFENPPHANGSEFKSFKIQTRDDSVAYSIHFESLCKFLVSGIRNFDPYTQAVVGRNCQHPNSMAHFLGAVTSMRKSCKELFFFGRSFHFPTTQVVAPFPQKSMVICDRRRQMPCGNSGLVAVFAV